MARVILLNPPHPEGKGFTREGRCTQDAGVWGTQWPPVSLVTAAALLEKDGHQLKVLDCPAIGMDQDRLKTVIGAFEPDFAFWNTATPTLAHDLSIGALTKSAALDVVTGVLGTHVTALPAVALDKPWVDMVIRGEPEETIRDVCSHQDQAWEAIEGISYQNHKQGEYHHNPDRDFLLPEDIPAPAWRHLYIDPYRLPLKGRPFLIVAPIRGCPYRCSFCTAPVYYGNRLRKRPVKNVVDEIAANVDTFGVRDFFIWADTFTADKTYVYQFCDEIVRRGLEISWTCNSRVDSVDSDMMALMKNAGAWMMSFGLESGSDRVLKQTGKRITVDQSRHTVSLAHQIGIKTSGHFILGLPGETRKSLWDTLRFALELPLDIAQFYTAAPFPGTGLYEQAVKEGWLQTDLPISQGQAVLNLPGLPAQRVDAFRRYAYRRFYGRPKTIRNILSMVRPGAVVGVLRSLRTMIGF